MINVESRKTSCELDRGYFLFWLTGRRFPVERDVRDLVRFLLVVVVALRVRPRKSTTLLLLLVSSFVVVCLAVVVGTKRYGRI